MDFELATKRLQRDHQRYKQRIGHKKQSLTLNQDVQVQRSKQQQQRIMEERQRKVEQQKQLSAYMEGWDRRLNVQSLSSLPKQQLELKATSIFGEGDKISMSPSVLERLMGGASQPSEEDSQPWTFRIAIVNPAYTFPASTVLQSLPMLNSDAEYVEDDEDDPEEALNSNAYLDELRCRYISFTHGTVIEFTQDEGFVGIPESIANVLLRHVGDSVVPRTRTKDSASPSPEAMDETDDTRHTDCMEDDTEKTPGHVAWGAFDIPSVPIEISMVRLPKGKSVILRPTMSAIQMGFYHLKDIKLVLEQSLMRTRATLTVGDTIHTWHRGKRFDLTVQQVTPSTFDAISCINTDLEIQFDVPVASSQIQEGNGLSRLDDSVTATIVPQPSLGRRLNETAEMSIPNPVSSDTAVLHAERLLSQLLPEPPIDQHENVVTIQIRYRDRRNQRRFDIHKATVLDVFDFVRVAFGDSDPMADMNQSIQLVQRYPRRLYSWQERSIPLSNAGIAAGSEVLFVEIVG